MRQGVQDAGTLPFSDQLDPIVTWKHRTRPKSGKRTDLTPLGSVRLQMAVSTRVGDYRVYSFIGKETVMASRCMKKSCAATSVQCPLSKLFK